MRESALRFGVFDGAGLHAATWKCWSPAGKEDIYLSCREMHGALKTSLHESGAWHVAFDGKFFHENVKPEDKDEKGRFLDKWRIPPAIGPGVWLALRIITPGSAVCTPHKAMPEIVQIPKAADMNAIESVLLITEPTTYVSDWPGKTHMRTSLVGSYALPSGRKVWVVYSQIPMPKLPTQTGRARFFRGKSLENLKGGDLRALAFADHEDGSKAIFECKLEHRSR